MKTSNPDSPSQQSSQVNYSTLMMMLNALPKSIYLISDDYRIIICNAFGIKKLQSQNDYVGKKCYKEIYDRNQPCPYCPARDNDFVLNSPIDKEIYDKTSTGEELSYQLRFVKGENDGVLLMETIEDTTQQKKKQADWMLQENLANLGIMVSGIAHELNNPLTGIGLTLQNLISNIHNFPSNIILEKLKVIKKDLMKASRIVSDILSFANPGQLRISRAGVSKIIQRAVDTTKKLYPALSRNVNWEITHDDNYIEIDVEKIERLFTNLFRNSIHAFDYDKGTIKVKIESGKKYVRLIIEDNAGGIKKENLMRIFQPFYSDSKSKQTSGLGLSICHSIVKEHNGTIHVRSANGYTRFYISLPLEQSKAHG